MKVLNWWLCLLADKITTITRHLAVLLMLVAGSSRKSFSHNHLSCLRDSYGTCYRILWTDWGCYSVRYFLFYAYIWFMMLSYIYLGHSDNTGLIPNLQFKNKSGRKYRETIYKGNLILYSLKGILCWWSWIVLPNTILSR